MCLPWSQQRGASSQWADEVNSQVSSVVIGEGESGLHMLQRAHKIRLPRAGLYTSAEDQVVSYVPTTQKNLKLHSTLTSDYMMKRNFAVNFMCLVCLSLNGCPGSRHYLSGVLMCCMRCLTVLTWARSAY